MKSLAKAFIHAAESVVLGAALALFAVLMAYVKSLMVVVTPLYWQVTVAAAVVLFLAATVFIYIRLEE